MNEGKRIEGEIKLARTSSKRRKACLLFSDINSCGGQARVAISMAKSLRQSGFETTLLTFKKLNDDLIQKNFGAKMQIDKQVIIPVWSYKFRTYYEFCLSVLSKFFSGIVVNPYTSDILPFADVTYVHYPKTLLIDKKTRTPFWRLYYAPYNVIEHSSSFRRREKLILANSHFTAEATKREFKVDPRVLYPPVDLSPFEEKRETKKNIILTISRFSSEKGLEKIPEIAKNVHAKFVVLGSLYDTESYRKVLGMVKKNNLSDRVTLIPDATAEVKTSLLRKAKVYFHPAPLEHFGISIVEGMGAGCIPVVFNSGGPKEFVPDEWRYNNDDEVASKIESGLECWSPSVGREMATVASRFRPERFEKGFAELVDLFRHKTDNGVSDVVQVDKG